MVTKKTDPAEGGQQRGGATNGAGGNTAGARKGAGAKGAGGQTPSKTAGAGKGTESGTGSEQKAPSARKGAAKQGGLESGSGRSAGAARSAAGGTGGGDLRGDARAFASGKPNGWNHEEWLAFLDDLRQKGYNIEDSETVGNLLERERLSIALERVPGIGPQRVRSIAERYGNIWRLKDVGAEELAREANIPRPLAERIVDSIR